MEELEKLLINQQYTCKLVEDGIKKASKLDREELINPKPRNENDIDIQILPMVTTKNTRNKNITLVVLQQNNISKTDDNIPQAMLNVTYIYSKWELKNLRRILCSPKHRKSQLQNANAKSRVVEHGHILKWVFHLISEERNSM